MAVRSIHSPADFLSCSVIIFTGHTRNDRIIFKFSLSDLQRPLLNDNLTNIAEAELQVHYKPQGQSQDNANEIQVDLFKVQSGRSSAEEEARVIHVDSKQLDLSRSALLPFDVTDEVQHWLHSSQDGVEAKTGVFEVGIRSSHGDDQAQLEQLLSGLQVNESQGEAGHHLLVLSHSPLEIALQKHRRMRRQHLGTSFCSTKARRRGRQCCIHELFIDFRRDLQWNWIMEPKGYYPNYCSGDCPYMWADDTQHATVLGLYHSLNPAAAAQPCCVAKGLDSLVTLYRTKTGQPKVEELSGVVATSCKCR